MDAFMRNRASDLGATLINGLVTTIDTGDNNQGPYKLSYSDFTNGDKKGELKELTVDLLMLMEPIAESQKQWMQEITKLP